MDPIVIGVLVLGILAIIALIAFVLYRAGFSVSKVKAKLPMVEVEASRDKPGTRKEDVAATGAQISQRAIEGGIIEKSGITAPADSAVEIDQQAKGGKSKIDDSPIKLT